MKKCNECAYIFDNQEWKCPNCQYNPNLINGYLSFAPEIIDKVESYDPIFFAKLAKVEAKNFWFRSRNRLIISAIKKFFPNQKNFLEIGCGTGFVLSGLEKSFSQLQLSGSEIFTQGLEFASQRLNRTQLFQMDALHIPFQDEFDGIGAFDVLEHIQEDHVVLGQIYQALKPQGSLILTVPQHPWLWSQADDYAFHVRRYQSQDLKRKVQQAGFKIVTMTSFVSLLLPLMILSRFSQRREKKNYDPLNEFKISSWLNVTLEFILSIERQMIQSGVSFPWGGSLLLVAIKI
ncbi:class I SAM-dependent methyltransferase [Dolichospermum sp. UHCC 0352]|jgi:SAM-dependent methyltransferase|uniref:class I SAM-dependent methyltransferase n=1 Tax=Dolichospermum sp. UHCC 0352 TaxID=2590011 RepID=UPI001447D150|nr:class I SAM-dependent methyltransferase [Dolichospermum sp. UHCC 0352]MTJ21033.1 class I SAM-dependent methyltransferase [Dolichospermum sp. UHCC 0352]